MVGARKVKIPIWTFKCLLQHAAVENFSGRKVLKGVTEGLLWIPLTIMEKKNKFYKKSKKIYHFVGGIF